MKSPQRTLGWLKRVAGETLEAAPSRSWALLLPNVGAGSGGRVRRDEEGPLCLRERKVRHVELPLLFVGVFVFFFEM